MEPQEALQLVALLRLEEAEVEDPQEEVALPVVVDHQAEVEDPQEVALLVEVQQEEEQYHLQDKVIYLIQVMELEGETHPNHLPPVAVIRNPPEEEAVVAVAVEVAEANLNPHREDVEELYV